MARKSPIICARYRDLIQVASGNHEIRTCNIEVYLLRPRRRAFAAPPAAAAAAVPASAAASLAAPAAQIRPLTYNCCWRAVTCVNAF
jgi:hypothetical protein